MGGKFKPRQQKTPRNAIVEDMLLTRKGGPMRDRRERRPKDARNFQDLEDQELDLDQDDE